MNDEYPPALVIAFTPPLRISEELDVSLNMGAHMIPSVRASADARWIDSPGSHDPRSIGVGAAGCLLAHLDAWQAVANFAGRQDPILVLESDSHLTRYGVRWYGFARDWMTHNRVQLLQVGSNRLEAVGTGQGSMAGTYVQRVNEILETGILPKIKPSFHQAFRSGTHAYLVMPEFAAWLARWQPDFKIPVDQWLHVLARDPRHRIFRSRQDLWTTIDRPSEIEVLGR